MYLMYVRNYCVVLLVFLWSTVYASCVTNVECDCDWRYRQHYNAKGCIGVYNETNNSTCNCPIHFSCPEIKTDPSICKLNGISYQVGDPVTSSNQCEICACVQDVFQQGATIQCNGIDCPNLFNTSSNSVENNCILVYQKDKCCPSKKCDVIKNAETPVCKYAELEYQIGQKIHPKENPCLVCYCDENWTGLLNSSSCYKFNCDIEKNIYDLKKGCVPIYHEKTCCPIEYHCPTNVTIQSSNDSNADKCYFENRYYDIGDIKYLTNCFSCECSIPPDFTCIHRVCPGPPNDDYVNCGSIYNPHTCCPEYNCTEFSIAPMLCPPIICQPGCEINVTGAHFAKDGNCPKCVCIESEVLQTNETIENQTDVGCICDWRYLKHYDAIGCTAVYDETNAACICPISFNCPKIEIDPTVCKLKGVTYGIGESVTTTNNCEICSCRMDAYYNGATIQCIGIECPHIFRRPQPLENNCVLVYESDKCCPSNRCDFNQTSDRKVCNYKDRVYQIGQKIYPDEDPCLICKCDENWEGINNSSCYTFQCDIEKKIYAFKQGCIPIYHEKTCCPIEYHCPKTVRNETTVSMKPENSLNASMCFFDYQYYNIGEILDIKHATHCVSCKCTIPPDFTCVHRVCPGPPNKDYINCQSIYKADTCCPEYNCTEPVNETVSSITITPLCVLPKCEFGCEIDESLIPDGGCRGCRCSNETHLRQTREARCSIPKCNSDCYLVPDDNGGCPVCKCGLCIPPKCICSSPKCEDGCYLERNVSYGLCPTCVCKRRTLPSRTTGNPNSCDVPNCESANCIFVTGSDGCLKCQCSSLCVPPRCFCSKPECNDGCEIDTDVPDGRCPGCICKFQPHRPSTIPRIKEDSLPTYKSRCPPVTNCNRNNCKTVLGSDGCGFCECEPMCPRLKCDSPCRPDFDPLNGNCHCHCSFDANREIRQDYDSISRGTSEQRAPKRKCPEVHCPSCDTTLGDDDCVVCLCKKDIEPVRKSCSNQICQGIRCKLVPDGSGCQKCSCDAPCPPLKCERSCSKVENPDNGKCPYCVCQFSPNEQ